MIQLNTTSAAILYGKTIRIATLQTLKGEDLGAGTTARSLIRKFYGSLMALGTKTPFYSIKLLFFLFKVVNICRDRAYKDNKHEQYKINSIDERPPTCSICSILLPVVCSQVYVFQPASKNFSDGACVGYVPAHVQ